MAKSPKKASDGFEEAPQAPFEGEPLSGSVSDWVKQLEREADGSGGREPCAGCNAGLAALDSVPRHARNPRGLGGSHDAHALLLARGTYALAQTRETLLFGLSDGWRLGWRLFLIVVIIG